MPSIPELIQMNKELDEAYTEDSSELELKETGKEGLKVGIQKNGQKYSVRDDRSRFFYPDEWELFWNALETEKQIITSDMLINTGARINEARNVKKKDIDFERRTMTLRVTKIKAKKGEKKCKPRTIKISTDFRDRLQGYLVWKKPDDYVPMLSKPATHLFIKKILKRVGIKDYWNFSAHNFRKTHGNWLKCLGMTGIEICQRLGHDMNTFLKSYGSPDIFSPEDKGKIKKLIGDII